MCCANSYITIVCQQRFRNNRHIKIEDLQAISYFMKNLLDFVHSLQLDYTIDNSEVKNVQGSLNRELKLDGWISLVLSKNECIILKFDNGEFINEGYVLNDNKVLKVFGNHEIDVRSYSEESIEEGIVDLDHGTRFEGYVLKESGVPFGFGKMYDDDGLLVYEGIMINWKRFGYGASYHNNGLVEYEGYWCDDKRYGSGKLYDRSGELVKEGNWWNGMEWNTDVYEGDGSQPISIGTKHLKLSDRCVLSNWDVSWFENLESIEIGDNCFESVQTFKIDGLNHLKSLKIGFSSFTPYYCYSGDESKSFHLLNCDQLETIEFGRYSFGNFAGTFELRNLKSLQSITIGSLLGDSDNFKCASFEIRGICVFVSLFQTCPACNLLF